MEASLETSNLIGLRSEFDLEQPEKQLWAAVFYQALWDVVKGIEYLHVHLKEPAKVDRQNLTKEERRYHIAKRTNWLAKREIQNAAWDALEWFRSDRRKINSFLSLCDLLDMEPDKVRAHVESIISEPRITEKAHRRRNCYDYRPYQAKRGKA